MPFSTLKIHAKVDVAYSPVVYSCKVVTVQSDAGGSGVGNVYRLGWKEECVDDEDDSCEVKLLKIVAATEEWCVSFSSHGSFSVLSVVHIRNSGFQ